MPATCFREAAEVDFYRLIKSILLIRLVFPDDLLVDRQPNSAAQRGVENMLWEAVFQHIRMDAPHSS